MPKMRFMQLLGQWLVDLTGWFQLRSSNASAISSKISRAAKAWRSQQAIQQTAAETYGKKLPEELSRELETTIALHKGHDAHIVVAVGSRIQCVLELERLFGRRYFFPRDEDSLFSIEWQQAVEVVRDRCECEGPCPQEFDTGIIVDFGEYETLRSIELPKIVERVFPVKTWRNVNHHETHALMSYYSSPFRSSLILSFDGGGNDGSWNVFLGQGLDVYRIARERINLAKAYTRIASFLPACIGTEAGLQAVCELLPEFPLEWTNTTINVPAWRREGYAGKLMGYSGITTPSSEASELIRQFYDWVVHGGDEQIPKKLLSMICRSEADQQSVAASAQDEFSKYVQRKVADYLVQLKREAIHVEGIVLVGGGALNVLANQVIRESLTSFTSPDSAPSGLPRDVYIPPSPGDSGLAVGAVWSLFPPMVRQPLQYLGFRLFDEEILEDEAQKRGAQRLFDLGGVEYLAELLTGGPAWQRNPLRKTSKPVIAVVRGRQEFGPRALGHRSLLAFPDSSEMRDRMNEIKFRQWWRPAAPMIADEALEYVFGHKFRSAYMEFAPLVREEVRERFPGLSHFDGTARHQSVGKEDEPWIHALLLAVGKRTGLAALINTSFNSRGKPICNTDAEYVLSLVGDTESLSIEAGVAPGVTGCSPLLSSPCQVEHAEDGADCTEGAWRLSIDGWTSGETSTCSYLCRFAASFVEEITRRTGNAKKPRVPGSALHGWMDGFDVFCRMLLSALAQESDSVYLDVLTARCSTQKVERLKNTTPGSLFGLAANLGLGQGEQTTDEASAGSGPVGPGALPGMSDMASAWMRMATQDEAGVSILMGRAGSSS
eukprot:Skav228598  [mRNA]  locus=scaffold5678:6215:20800:+ [translate_table: standard]